MSFTKQTIEQFKIAANSISSQTMEDNDLTELLNSLNCVIEISDEITTSNASVEFYWNEIISGMLAVIYSAITGYPKLGLSGLRSVLELVCHAMYYLDHPIELQLSINENLKADKYVSTLVTEHKFFTTNYIKTFHPNIVTIQKKEDSVSEYLKEEYRKLCDVVHGRHSTLTKQGALKIEYSKAEYKLFESHFIKIASIIANLYILRFSDFEKQSIIVLSKKTNLINI